MLPFPAKTSGRGFFVAPPEAGALIAAQSASQSILTSSLSSLEPVLLITIIPETN
jgi:transcription termination factor Rho